MEKKIVETSGGRTKVEVHEGGSGEDLLFLHGAGGLLPDDPFLEALSATYHVVAPVLPGYGESEGEDALSNMLEFTLHQFDVMQEMGLDSPIVVGHSMGGMIGAEMAAINTHAIKRLALICPAGLWIDDVEIPDLFALLPYEMPALLFHDAEAGAAMMTGGGDPNDPDFLVNYMVNRAKTLGQASKILFPIPDRGLADRLYRITAKTEIIWGASDGLIPAAYGKAFNEGIAGSHLTVVEEASHMVLYEQTASVLEAIARVA